MANSQILCVMLGAGLIFGCALQSTVAVAGVVAVLGYAPSQRSRTRESAAEGRQ